MFVYEGDDPTIEKLSQFMPHTFVIDENAYNLGENFFDDVVQWCSDRFGVGLDVTHIFDSAILVLVIVDQKWAYDAIAYQINFHDPNHAFEFRMRWC